MNDEEQNQANGQDAPEPEKPTPVIRLGGTSVSQDVDTSDDEATPAHQTMVIGLNDSEQDSDKQIQVVGPQYQAEKQEPPKSYQSESQKYIEENKKKKNLVAVIVIITGFVLVLIAGYGVYRLL